MRCLLFVLLSIYYFSAFPETTIQCNNPEYAGKELVFFTYSDPVSLTKKEVFRLKISSAGNASHIIETNSTDFVFCDFGIYRGLLFIEPNQTINLQLPPVREKSFADQKNPYFVPVSFWFATENKKQLNNQISKFTFELNSLSDKYFNQIYFRQSKNYFDSLQFFIEKKFGNIESEPFVFHKTFSLELIKTDAFRLKPEDYSSVFSSVNQEYYLYPAFTTLFEKAFSGLLSFEAKSVKRDDIRKATNEQDIRFIGDYFQKKYQLSGEILDLVLLKLLHDAWYSGDFTKTAVEELIKNKRFTTHQSSFIRNTSANISEKINHLQKGTVAPAICLKNMNGEKICTNSKKDKFKYIIFADTEMAVCREHLKYLPTIQQKFEKHLEIFVVLRNTGRTELEKFLVENKVPGTILIDEKNEYINLYKVKSFPQCYLMDENHKVTFEDTKAPLDGFEQQFGSFLRMELFQRQRNQK